jgi:glutathione synthase/RimK-type ligase-like ATP-grasp enzyme
VRVAFATCSLVPDRWPDDFEAAALLDADFLSWDDPAADWGRYDRVLLRSVFNYTHRVEDFLAWCSALGAGRVLNPPELVRFNAERYLAQLAGPTVPTTFVGNSADLPEWDEEIVVKPNISSGARDTGRFSQRKRADAAALVDRIRESGRVALVQPYLASVGRTLRVSTTTVSVRASLSGASCLMSCGSVHS